MDHISEPSLKKILLDFSEYERLKHIESKYIELQNKTNVSSLKSSAVSAHQKGGQHQNQNNENQTGEGETDLEQIGVGNDDYLLPATSKFENEVTQSNLLKPYSVNVVKDDLNTSFDETRLLALVPKSSLQNAKLLLKQFNDRANELTWNSSGTIFINQTSLPLSNIFELFPLLFKKNAPHITGFVDFVEKINDMGLSDLINVKIKSQNFEPNEITVGGGNLTTYKSEQFIDTPWWYIGD